MIMHFAKSLFLIFLILASTDRADAQWWNPFKPKDYEECAATAARDSKSRDSLKILLQDCATRFTARRNTKGPGYVYWDETKQGYEVSGPNPTNSEWKWIRSEQKKIRAKQKQDRENRRRKTDERKRKIQQAKRNVSLENKNLSCQLGCSQQRISATVKNNSHLTIDSITLGWLVREPDPNDRSCPRTYNIRKSSFIRIEPGSSGHVTMAQMFLQEFKFSGKSFAYCIGIVDVSFVPD